jgi:hypothetical protein
VSVNVDLCEHILVAITAAGVGVGLIDQLLDRAFAVSDSLSPARVRATAINRLFTTSARKSDPYELLFDNDPTRIFFRPFQKHPRMFEIFDADGCAFTMIAIKRLYDHRVIQAAERVLKLVYAADPISLRHGHAHVAKQVLVACLLAAISTAIMFCGCRCRRLNPFLVYRRTRAAQATGHSI